MRIVRCAVKLSLRPASCCRLEVMNGAGGRCVYGFSVTSVTVYSASATAAATARARCISTSKLSGVSDCAPSESA